MSMWWRKYFYCVIFCLYEVSGEYNCDMVGKNISCTALTEENLNKSISVRLSDEDGSDLEELKILNSSIATIKNKYFRNFKNIGTLYLVNTQINDIEEGAFAELYSLNNLFLSNNYLQNFSSNTFTMKNSLYTLDLSQNLINNLSNFDIDIFPLLTIMNVSHNRLEYLPENILNKLKEENTFYLVVDNNPWNCSHPVWVPHLNDVLVQALCVNNTYNASDINDKVLRLANLVERKHNFQNVETFKCSITCCLVWASGAIWLGIIIGNACKIKRLLFTQPPIYESKNTQYDKADLLVKAPG